MRQIIASLLLFVPGALLATGPGPAPDPTPPVTREVVVGDGDTVPVEVYPAGAATVVWFAPGYGFQDSHREFALALAREGVTVWLVDLLDALFMTRSPDAYRELTGARVAELLEVARAESARGTVAVMAEEYAAIPALRGLRALQERHPGRDPVLGAVLFNPALYAGVPALGEPPPYLPVTAASNAPLLVVQAGDTNNRWYLDGLLERLAGGGARAYTRLLPGVRSLFYFKEPTPAEARLRRDLARQLPAALELLARTPHPLAAAPLAAAGPAPAGLDYALAPYRGRVRPQPIALADAAGAVHRLQDYRGQVTVLNFWATWCPPCVEEIPSLNRLRERLAGRPFELVSVNYGEDPQAIRAFMDRVQVDFPVLVDPEGRVSAQWRVFTLPSTFVIAPDGSIAYGVNAAIPWDAPEVVAAIAALVLEAAGSAPKAQR